MNSIATDRTGHSGPDKSPAPIGAGDDVSGRPAHCAAGHFENVRVARLCGERSIKTDGYEADTSRCPGGVRRVRPCSNTTLAGHKGRTSG